ncbi:MAG TPA: hypothetical protein VF701_00070, partial [Thermoanaerobaculia bacterium]
MNRPDEALVREVFGRIAVARPSLSKYPSVIDDEEERLEVLASQLISRFPWPIGIELRRLFNCPNLDRGRLDQLFKTIERTMQFLSFILLSQFLEEVISNGAKTSPAFRKEFPGRFRKTTMGNFEWLVRSLGTLLHEQQITPFAGELKHVLGTPFYNALDFWSPERNDIGHYQYNLSQGEIEKRCVEHAERLTSILGSLAFLVNYPLVTVREVRVLKRKRRDASFAHTLDILNKSDSNFVSREARLETFCDSPGVLL